jgi:cell division protein DivIC
MKLLRYIPAWLRNKYLLAFAAFAVIMVFFGENDLISQYHRTEELKKLNAGKKYYQAQIEQSKKELLQLQTNPATLEKYAREKYRMKKDNEDIYIVPDYPADSKK